MVWIKTAIFILIGGTLAHSQISLQVNVKDSYGNPLKGIGVSIDGAFEQRTNAQGLVVIGLSHVYEEGRSVKFTLDDSSLVINSPVDGNWNLPNLVTQKFQFVDLIAIEKGSLELLSDDRVENILYQLFNSITYGEKKFPAKYEKEKENRLQIITNDLNIPMNHIINVLDDWVSRNKYSQDIRRQGLSKFYNGNYSESTKLLKQAAKIGLDLGLPNNHQVIMDLVTAGKGLFFQDSTQGALNIYEQAIDLANGTLIIDSSLLFDAYIGRAKCYLRQQPIDMGTQVQRALFSAQQNIEAANKFLSTSLRVDQELNFHILSSKIHLMLGMDGPLSQKRDNLKKAQLSLQEAYNLVFISKSNIATRFVLLKMVVEFTSELARLGFNRREYLEQAYSLYKQLLEISRYQANVDLIIGIHIELTQVIKDYVSFIDVNSKKRLLDKEIKAFKIYLDYYYIQNSSYDSAFVFATIADLCNELAEEQRLGNDQESSDSNRLYYAEMGLSNMNRALENTSVGSINLVPRKHVVMNLLVNKARLSPTKDTSFQAYMEAIEICREFIFPFYEKRKIDNLKIAALSDAQIPFGEVYFRFGDRLEDPLEYFEKAIDINKDLISELDSSSTPYFWNDRKLSLGFLWARKAIMGKEDYIHYANKALRGLNGVQDYYLESDLSMGKQIIQGRIDLYCLLDDEVAAKNIINAYRYPYNRSCNKKSIQRYYGKKY